MKRFLYAAALVGLVASVGRAEETPAAPAPAPAVPAVITTAGTPVAEYAPAQPTRRGLFGRLRNRNSGTTSYSPAPVMTAPIATTPITTTPSTPTPMPSSTPPQPMPMPGAKTGTSSAMPMPGAVVQASGNLPAGTYTTTDGTIVQIGGTQTAPESTMTTETQSGRRGLFGRLRNR